MAAPHAAISAASLVPLDPAPAAGLPQPLGLIVLLLTSGAFVALCVSFAYAWRLTHPPRKTASWALARNYATDPSELDTPRAFDAYELDLGPSARATPVWDIEGDDPSGPVLIMTPGWADSRLGQLTRVPGLAPACRRLILWDPPAHGEAGLRARGRSSGVCALGTREPAMLRTLMEHAQKTHDAPVALFGSSLGGGVAIAAAAQTDRPPVAVIAEAPYRHAITPARNVIGGMTYPTRGLLRLSFVGLSLALGQRPVFSWFCRDGGPFDRCAFAAKLACPLLVVHGDTDPVSPVEDGRAIAAAAAGGSITVVEGGGHNNLWIDAAAEFVVADACRGFLRRSSRGG